MGLIKNKRGWYLSGAAFFMLLIVLLYSIIVINADQREHLSDFKYIGQRSLDLINSYTEIQLNLTYYDSLGRIVFPKTLNELGLSGGFYRNNDCGNFAGSEIWVNDDQKCKPDYLNSLQVHFMDVISLYDRNNYFLSYLDNGVFVASAINPNLINENNITTSFRPNFKFNSGYDLNIYETAFKKAEEIADLCENKNDFSFCVKERLAHYSRTDENFDWVENCKTNEERVFYSFVKQIEKCLNSVGNSCYCDIDLKNFEGYVGDLEMTIKIESNGKISFNNLYHQFDNNLANFGTISSYSNYDELYIMLKYEQGHLINLGFNDQPIETSFSTAHTNPNLFLYKYYHEGYHYNENFVLITDHENSRQCRTFTRHATVCIENQNDFLIYDFNNDRLEHKKIPLQFSIYVPDNIPPDPIEFNVINNPDKSKSLLLFFNRSDAYDISHYNVYVEKQDFSSLENFEPKFVFEDFDLSGYEQIKSLYVGEDLTFYVTITPVDAFGNENEDINVLQVTSLDDGPVQSIPIQNININIDANAEDNFEFNYGFPSQAVQGGNN